MDLQHFSFFLLSSKQELQNKRREGMSSMAPRKKRRCPQQNQDQNQGAFKKKKDGHAQSKKSSSATNNNSCFDSDEDVCMISPPPSSKGKNQSPILIMSGKTSEKPGKQIYSRNSEANLELFKAKLHLIPVKSAVFLHDLDQHKGVLGKLGLLDLANLEFVSEPCLDELASLVMNYDSESGFSEVVGAKIRVNKVELAKVLRLQFFEEQDVLQVPELEASPSYVIADCRDETVRAVLYLVANRICPSSDDSMTFCELVDVVEKALKDNMPVDWAGIIWSRAEKELLQGLDLKRCYYASHFQMLIRMRRASTSAEGDSVKLSEEKGNGNLESRLTRALNLGDAIEGENSAAHSEKDEDVRNDCGQHSSGDRDWYKESVGGKLARCPSSVDGGNDVSPNLQFQDSHNYQNDLRQEIPNEGSRHSNQMAVSSGNVTMDGFVSAEPNLKESERRDNVEADNDVVNPTSLRDPVTSTGNAMFSSAGSISAEQQLMELQKGILMHVSNDVHMNEPDQDDASDIEKCMSLSLDSTIQRAVSAKPMLNEKDALTNSNANNLQSSFSDPYLFLNNQTFHSGNATLREGTEEDDDLQITFHKKLKSEETVDFGTCMSEIGHLIKRAFAAHVLEKETLARNYNIELQNLSEQLRHRDYAIETMHLNKQQDVEHLQNEYIQLKHRFNITNRIFNGYRSAVQDATQAIERYRNTLLQKETIISNLEERMQQILRENELLKEMLKPSVPPPDDKPISEDQVQTDAFLAQNGSLEPMTKQSLTPKEDCPSVQECNQQDPDANEGMKLDKQKENVAEGNEEPLKPPKSKDDEVNEESLKLPKSDDVEEGNEESPEPPESKDLDEGDEKSLKQGKDLDGGNEESIKLSESRDADTGAGHSLNQQKSNDVDNEDKEFLKSPNGRGVDAACNKLDAVNSGTETSSREPIHGIEDQKISQS